jgi:hypothetical protein
MVSRLGYCVKIHCEGDFWPGFQSRMTTQSSDDPTSSFSYTVRHSPLDTTCRRPIRDVVSPARDGWDHVANIWYRLRADQDDLPRYDDFDIILVPPRLWAHTCVTCLEGSPRRYQVRMIGSAIEANNGFFGDRRPMSELPLRNRHVMAREFAWALRLGCPVYSEGPYIGAADYVKQVRRVITPYRLSAREYAFVFHAEFSAMPGHEHRMVRT